MQNDNRTTHSRQVGNKRRGPRRVEFVPRALRAVPGIHHVATSRQLRRLQDYLLLPAHTRPPYIRLGCSVSHGTARQHNPPNSTWAVSVDGRVEVIHFPNRDPRAAYKFVTGADRAWNIAHRFGMENGIVASSAQDEWLYYIVSFAADEQSSECQSGPDPFVADRTRIANMYRSALTVDGVSQYIVEGRENWWLAARYDNFFFNVRPAVGEVFTTGLKTLWVTRAHIIELKSHGFADYSLMSHHGLRIPDLRRHLEDCAVTYVRLRLGDVTRTFMPEQLDAIRQATRSIDVITCMQSDLDALLPELKRIKFGGHNSAGRN